MAHYSKEPYNISGSNSSGGGGGGLRILTGKGAPTAELGQPGDFYLNTGNGDYYHNKNGTWKLEMNINGKDGAQGPAGKDGAPGPAGKDGEQGPKGEPGAPGKDGTNGTDGAAGPAGKDGFPSEEQWNTLVARVTALEGAEG